MNKNKLHWKKHRQIELSNLNPMILNFCISNWSRYECLIFHCSSTLRFKMQQLAVSLIKCWPQWNSKYNETYISFLSSQHTLWSCFGGRGWRLAGMFHFAATGLQRLFVTFCTSENDTWQKAIFVKWCDMYFCFNVNCPYFCSHLCVYILYNVCMY